MAIIMGDSSTILSGSGTSHFGDSADDCHFITGSMFVSGALSIDGDLDVVGSLSYDGSTALTVGAGGKITKIGDDTPTDGQVLTWDNSSSKVVWSTAGGGGSTAADDITSGDAAITLGTTSGGITLDSATGEWDFQEGATSMLKIKSHPDSNDVYIQGTIDNGQIYLAKDTTTGTVNGITISTDGGDTAYVGVNFQSSGPTNLLEIKCDENSDQGLVVKSSESLSTSTLTTEGLYYGRLKMYDTSGGSAIVKSQISSRPGVHNYFLNNNVGIGTSSPAYELDVVGDAQVSGDIYLDDGGSLKEAGGVAAITFDGSGHVTKIGQDTPATDEVLTWDGSKAVWSSAGGGSSDTFVMDTIIKSYATYYNSSGYHYYKSLGASGVHSNLVVGSTPNGVMQWYQIAGYAICGIVPVACELTSWSLAGWRDKVDSDNQRVTVYKATPVDGASETATPTITEIFYVDVDEGGNAVTDLSGTLSSGNSFSAGDIWFTMLSAPTASASCYMNHKLTCTFTPT